jgi:hypothetical protein
MPQVKAITLYGSGGQLQNFLKVFEVFLNFEIVLAFDHDSLHD